MLIFWSKRQPHNHSEALNARAAGKEFASGDEQVKTNGQAPGEGWVGACHQAKDHKRQAVFYFNQQMLRTEMM